ncbi:hypothetical protein AVI51_01590 [Piscirickettsia salmonis]|uniref:Uncharacterized protein n=1 Tax=Piscirickettsia salmonis TaxID=1238 RepID=A0A9Q5VIH5_PISSA|nr:hypothetical protein [Piscirickettsia salmonis]RNC78324.1 hypothetical protein DA717_05315 [Piscirickettsiaceae bacterium NZ-RLO2]ALA24752.1 hypothetical protein KW89_1284 [Piscirickettsia salmonis]APS45082.1 hypothetical protein AVI48_12320 [Piscirickettsia salmonis]APS48442.1 hypothetical protein AVI49_12930 [Piscirickettsia salmonis]APS49701.1 hypothetical protein AVI50_01635 [Piscirickettsia salmonis]
MKRLSLQQNISYLICIIITVVITLAIKPSYPNDPRGILLPASSQQFTPLQADQVQLVNYLPGGIKVGAINIEMHLTSTQAAEVKTAMGKVEAYAKALAAQSGANAVAVIGGGIANSPQPLTALVFRGVAFRN